MNNQIIPFQFNSNEVRLVDCDGAYWFVLHDICKILEFNDSAQATRTLDEDETQTLHNMQGITKSRNGIVKLVSESGLYALILRSRKPEARRFRKWVTSEVLPSIRISGGYTPKAPSPNFDPATYVAKAASMGVLVREIAPTVLILDGDRQSCDVFEKSAESQAYEQACNEAPQARLVGYLRSAAYQTAIRKEIEGLEARKQALEARLGVAV